MRRPVFIYSVILLAMVVAGFGFFSISDLDWKGIIIFLLLAALAEANQIELFENNTVSVSVAATFAAAIVGGIPGAAMAGAVIAIIHYVKMRPDWYKSAFNWSVHLLAALPAALFPVVTSRLNIQFETTFLAVLILLAIPVIALVYLIESGLMATVMGLSMRTSVVLLWRERFQWLGINYLVLGILGLFLAIGYLQIGLGSVVLFILPVLVMYATQKMYIQRTRSSVRELRRMNEELSQANVEIVKANHEIQRMNDQLFLTLAKVIDARDRDVAGHAARVSAYATAIATHLELPGEKREQIRQAALLHDIGKLGIPEKILSKTTRLSKEEFEIVKQHAELGAELLETIDVLRQLAPAVRHHHEHWNGNGYPYGLKQDEIPLDARILAISDAVEVMLSGRPYEPAKSIHEVLEEVRSHMGTQFDPLVAQAFIELAGTTQNLGIHSAANDALWPTTDEDPQRSDKPRVHPLRPVATVS